MMCGRRRSRLKFSFEILNDADDFRAELRQLAVSDALDREKLIGRLRTPSSNLFERAVVQNNVRRNAERPGLFASPLLQRLHQLRAIPIVESLNRRFLRRWRWPRSS